MREQEGECGIPKPKGYKIGAVLCSCVFTLNLSLKSWEAVSLKYYPLQRSPWDSTVCHLCDRCPLTVYLCSCPTVAKMSGHSRAGTANIAERTSWPLAEKSVQPFNLLFHLPKRIYSIHKLDYMFMANLQWFCNKCNSSICVWCGRECYMDVCACGHAPLSSVGAPAVRASWLARGSGCCVHWGTTTTRYHLTPGERSWNSSDANLDKSFNLYFLNFGMRVLLFPSWGCMNRMKFFLCEFFVSPWITQHTQYSKAFNKTSYCSQLTMTGLQNHPHELSTWHARTKAK